MVLGGMFLGGMFLGGMFLGGMVLGGMSRVRWPAGEWSGPARWVERSGALRVRSGRAIGWDGLTDFRQFGYRVTGMCRGPVRPRMSG
jgi:hypothetical protein